MSLKITAFEDLNIQQHGLPCTHHRRREPQHAEEAKVSLWLYQLHALACGRRRTLDPHSELLPFALLRHGEEVSRICTVNIRPYRSLGDLPGVIFESHLSLHIRLNGA